MKKEIEEYLVFIQEEVDKGKSSEEVAKLIDLHKTKIAEFEHERLVHLIITLFFGFMFFVVMALTIAVATDSNSLVPPASVIGMCALALILCVLELFYIKHYYFLENSVQKMYKYDYKLYKKL